MQAIVLNAESRNVGKKGTKAVRNAGSVPCVLYGTDMDPVHFQVSELSLKPLIYTHETHTVELQLGKDKWQCILRDIDFHPVTDRPIHADFQLLLAGQTIRMTVPVQLVGTPAGQLEGGVTQQILSEIEIECLPQDIPGHLELNVSDMNIGDTMHVSDLEFGNITILTSLDRTVVTVAGAAPEEEEVVEEELLEGEEAELEGAEGEEGAGEGSEDADADEDRS